MSNKYDGFNHLRREALGTAAFLATTAERVLTPQGMSIADIANRLKDCAKVLREAEENATATFMTEPEA